MSTQAMDGAVGARLAAWVRTEIALASKSLAIGGSRIHAGIHQARKSIRLGAMQDLSLLIERCGRGSIFVKPDRAQLRRYARRKLARQRERIASVTHPE